MESVLQHHWQHLNLATLPPSRRGSSLAFDSRHQQTVFVAAGETWLWNGRAWSQVRGQNAPPARNTTHLTYDTITECVLLFGGIGVDGTPLNDVWLWNGVTWTEQRPADLPAPVGGAAMACDALNQQVILFGGLAGFDGFSGSNRVGTFSNATWVWDGSTWTELSMDGGPPARMGAQMVYDEARQQIVLFGGNNPTGYLNDMWSWNGGGWDQLNPTSLPPVLVRGRVAFHAQLQQVMLLGVGVANQLQYAYQTWLWDGASWTQYATNAALPGNIEGFTYDAARNTIVACIVTGGKGLLANKSANTSLPELAAPALTSQIWVWG